MHFLFMHLGSRTRLPERPRGSCGRRNSAGQAVMFLADHTPGATLLLRGGDIRKSMSDYLARRIERHPKIEIIRHVEVDAIERDHTITRLRLRDGKDGNTRGLDCSAVFVFIGAQPRTDWLPASVAVDSKGFILTGADAAKSDRWPLIDREPCSVETTSPGVFAAGDVRSGTTKRVAFAVGDGALAVTCAASRAGGDLTSYRRRRSFRPV